VNGVRGDELLRRAVRVRGIHIGHPVDVLLHPTKPQALGLDVLCGDDRHRFLPFRAATLHEDHVEAASPLVLLDLREDGFYRREARPLGELRGTPLGGTRTLQDVVLGRDWSVEELVLDGDRVPLDGIALPPRSERRRASWLRRPRRRRGRRRSR
jgi:hypothetical protein